MLCHPCDRRHLTTALCASDDTARRLFERYNTLRFGWRRRRDSNPRDDSSPTPLAGERICPQSPYLYGSVLCMCNVCATTTQECNRVTQVTWCQMAVPHHHG